MLIGVHRWLYQYGWLRAHRVDATVIVVGNVVAGGAGKTPTAIELVRYLRAQGISVGIISRGYGRKSSQCMEVTPTSNAADTGDEPLLMQRATQVPVFVAAQRHTAAHALLKKYPSTQIIVSDDGLQHYALRRDVEICVFDERGCGNGWLLPAGPLRQRWPRRALAAAGQTDGQFLVLHTGSQCAFQGHHALRTLSPFARRSDGSTIALSSIQTPDNKPLLALAGIARPEAFFSMLRESGLRLDRTIGFADHYDFDSYLRSICEGFTVVCTEKDATKLWNLVPDALAVPLQLQIPTEFLVEFDTAVAQCLNAKLSSSNGHQIT